MVMDMIVALLFAAFFLVEGTSNYVGKKMSMIAVNICRYGIILIFTSVFAMINFAVISGFDITFSPVNIVYGIIYGVCCCLSVVFSMVTLKYSTVAFKMIFVGSLSLVLNQIAGIIIFKEAILAENIIKCILRIISAIVVVAPVKYGQKTEYKGIIMCCICVLVEVLCSVVTKSGAMQKNLDPDSWFFITNLFLFIISTVFTLFIVKLHKFKVSDEIQNIGMKGLFWVFLSAVASNLFSLLSVKLMSLVDLSYYSPVSSALTMIACFVVSRFVLGEAAGKRMYIAVILSIFAVTI